VGVFRDPNGVLVLLIPGCRALSDASWVVTRLPVDAVHPAQTLKAQRCGFGPARSHGLTMIYTTALMMSHNTEGTAMRVWTSPFPWANHDLYHCIDDVTQH
jgi:hypothetical protein